MSDLEAAIARRLEAFTADRVAERLWAKDGTLWAASGKPPEEIAGWLGWLDLPESMAARVTELEHLARDVREDGYRRAAVLGMGGSSLAPELFSRVFGWAGGPAGTGAAARTVSSFGSSTRPTPTRCGASDRGRRSSAPSSSSAPSPAPRPSRTPTRRRWRRSRRPSTSWPSPTRARRSASWPAPRSSGPSSRRRPTSVGGTRR